MAASDFNGGKEEICHHNWNNPIRHPVDSQVSQLSNQRNECAPDCENGSSVELADASTLETIWAEVNNNDNRESGCHSATNITMSGVPSTTWDGISSEIDLISRSNVIPEGRVVGVYFDKQRRIWRANWREGGVGRRKTKNFSVDDYGFEEARRLAIQYRLLKIMEASDKQMFNNHESEQAMWLSQVLKRKTGDKKGDVPSKGKKQRRYNLNSQIVLKGSAWTSNSDAQMDMTGFTGIPPEYLCGHAQLPFAPGNDMPVFMINYGCHTQNPTYYSPRGNVAPPLPHPALGLWNGSPRSQGKFSHDETDFCDFVDGMPAESLYVVSSSPLPDDPGDEMTFNKGRDLSTTADTASSDEIDDGLPQQSMRGAMC